MTAWMAVNSECIYDARPWTIYGEVPTVKNDATASDIRFTTKGDVLYAVVMGKPDGGKANIKSLATNSPHYQGEIGSVQLLGSSGNLEITRDENGLSVTLPTQRTKSDEFGIALKTIPKA
jgi:alpha-L-fucosidase